jgi:hypothetical protein
MIQKIISGGQTGADQAALDVAIKLDIPHGGWIPKGRITEAGILPAKYKLKEMATASYPKRTVKNVLDSDGTLILSHGKLTGGSSLTQKFANQHGRHCLHIDLNKTIAFNAALEISTWVEESSIEVLNVAGPRVSKDAGIYNATMDILESAYYLSLSKGHKSDSLQTLFSREERAKEPSYKPRTVNEAVDDLIFKLSLKDKATIANMTEQELFSLHFSLGKYIRNSYGIWDGNEELISNCRFLLKKDTIHEDEVSSLIIKKLWENLRKTHRLKIIK